MFVSFNAILKNNCLNYPQRLALSYKNQVYSYKELNKRTNQFAYYLKNKGMKKGTLVAIISENYLERIVAIISLWKLSAAYLPIDPNYPSKRINFILNDSKVDFVITDNEIYKKLVLKSTVTSILTDDENKDVSTFPTDDLLDFSAYNDIAYIAYTSGSTGNPKGTMITQGNISSIYHAWEQIYKLTCDDRHLQIANFGFDVCSGDIIRALGSGAQLVICPPEIMSKPDWLYDLLARELITIAEFTPIVLRKLITYLEHKALDLHFMRLLICGSDGWYLKEYKKFRSFLTSQARLINSYGTTEATIDSTYFEMDEQNCQFDEQSFVPVGRPFPNTLIEILNDKLEACSPGIPGEIYIGGGGVSLGYLNQPKLTEEKFIMLSREDKNSIFYKTGDLGCYLPDGNIKFLGRTDYQVKIRGYRVNLLEVEDILNSYPAIQKAVVVKHSTLRLEENFLVAFIRTNRAFTVNDYIDFLKKNLPAYAIPLFYLTMLSFPISAHGKLDRLKLVSQLNHRKKVEYNQKGSNSRKMLLITLQEVFNIGSLSDDCFFYLNSHPVLLEKFLRGIEHKDLIKPTPLDLSSIHTINNLIQLTKNKKNNVENN